MKMSGVLDEIENLRWHKTIVKWDVTYFKMQYRCNQIVLKNFLENLLSGSIILLMITRKWRMLLAALIMGQPNQQSSFWEILQKLSVTLPFICDDFYFWFITITQRLKIQYVLNLLLNFPFVHFRNIGLGNAQGSHCLILNASPNYHPRPYSIFLHLFFYMNW